MEYNLGDILLYPHGTIIRIVDINCMIKVRAINTCKGKYSSKKRIGKPYTYQFWTTSKKLDKSKVKKIGTEEILNAVFNYKYIDKIFNKRQ